MDWFARAAAIVTGLLMLIAIVFNARFAGLDEERDGERLSALLLMLAVVGCAAVIVAESLGPHVG